MYYVYMPDLFVLFLSAGAFGDPHMMTLDGKQYSFNGLGEYHLIDIETTNSDSLDQTNFTAQARTKSYINENGENVGATVFVAFAFRDHVDGTLVQIELNSNKSGTLVTHTQFCWGLE